VIDQHRPVTLVVSGAPGSGKSTLAQKLADATGLPLFGKDAIKEAACDGMDITDVATSRQMGAAAVRAILRLAEVNPHCILESVWRRDLAVHELGTLPGRVVEIHCDCPVDISRSRFQRRAPSRHAAHLDHLRMDEDLWGPQSGPIDGGWPVLLVDTTEAVDIDRLVHRVITALAAPA
jgi:predicted kinase